MEEVIWERLRDANIPVLPMIQASTAAKAVDAANVLGYPVVMKILSPDISHKSDVGGVVLSLGSDGEVEAAYHTMMERVISKVPDARIKGVVLQKMAQPGLEVIVGAKRDPQFGHVIMFGLGGIFVEICRDVSFRVTPVDREMARQMILEIKGSPILGGARGRKAVDMEKIIDVITGLSLLLDKYPEILELDINPLVVYPDGAYAVDARMLSH
ncbi:MAG: acetate--CoA ligase family protein [Methanosarcinales archaeon]|nr:acetate--CoA ligase family protein [ANME-2 cluster archaeon]MDW7776563.1 acetate--CoA ligase family protein [Methanosarcinales archaeon]